MNNNKTIEEITSGWIKNLGTDEPSADFTQKVMQSILSENQPAYSSRQRNYFWLIGLIPVIIIISWYLLVIFHLTVYIDHLWISVTRFIQPVLSDVLSLFIQLKSISIQPSILITLIAILFLLIIEEFVGRTKHLI
jgi:hypothetical protein